MPVSARSASLGGRPTRRDEDERVLGHRSLLVVWLRHRRRSRVATGSRAGNEHDDRGVTLSVSDGQSPNREASSPGSVTTARPDGRQLPEIVPRPATRSCRLLVDPRARQRAVHRSVHESRADALRAQFLRHGQAPDRCGPRRHTCRSRRGTARGTVHGAVRRSTARQGRGRQPCSAPESPTSLANWRPAWVTSLLDELDDVEHRHVEADDHAADVHTHDDDQQRLDAATSARRRSPRPPGRRSRRSCRASRRGRRSPRRRRSSARPSAGTPRAAPAAAAMRLAALHRRPACRATASATTSLPDGLGDDLERLEDRHAGADQHGERAGEAGEGRLVRRACRTTGTRSLNASHFGRPARTGSTSGSRRRRRRRGGRRSGRTS